MNGRLGNAFSTWGIENEKCHKPRKYSEDRMTVERKEEKKSHKKSWRKNLRRERGKERGREGEEECDTIVTNVNCA